MRRPACGATYRTKEEPMSFAVFVAARLADYPRVHRTRVNLAVHAVAVPLFWAGLALLVRGAARLSAVEFGLGAAVVLASVVLEGVGHAREPERAVPFRGPGDFALRYAFEQLITFPHFVLTGGWARAWRGRPAEPARP
jgi:hypothetical protein